MSEEEKDDGVWMPGWDHKCPHCKEVNEKSEVTLNGASFVTAMYGGPGHYDEDGVFHPPPKINTRTTGARCSKGHGFVVREKVW